MRVPSGGTSPVAILNSGLTDPWAIAVDSTSVYFTNGTEIAKLTPK